MNNVVIQNASTSTQTPSEQDLQTWIDSALHDYAHDTEIVVRIVDEPESAALNSQYRHKQGATNILSFPADLPEELELDLELLGDLVVCAPVLEREAKEQNKVLQHHWAHIIIHGVLHLLGYDHLNDTDAEEMETKEIALLQTLNISNPYEWVTD